MPRIQNKEILERAKIAVFKTIYRPILVYACKTLVLLTSNEVFKKSKTCDHKIRNDTIRPKHRTDYTFHWKKSLDGENIYTDRKIKTMQTQVLN